MKFGVVGLGGFGRAVCHAILNQGSKPGVNAQLRCVFDPAPNHAALQDVHDSGAIFANSLEELLASDVDIVWLPLPIQLHRPYTERVLAAGKAVMCEKPAAGTVADVDAMTAAAQAAGRPAAIGFQDMYEPSTHELKRLLCDGFLGDIQSVIVTGSWPRSDAYYNRGNWPGRKKVDGAWVLDSPANNALAHFINLGLFWLGTQPDTMGHVADVQGELYRAHAIENFDTCAFRARMSNGARLLAYLTHVGEAREHPMLTIKGTRGQAIWRMSQPIEITTSQGTKTIDVLPAPAWCQVGQFAKYVATKGAEGYAFTPAMAREHTRLIWALSQSSDIQTFDAKLIRPYTGPNDERYFAVDGLNNVFSACAQRECLPSELGSTPWAHVGRVVLA